jgi:hypothetical protein
MSTSALVRALFARTAAPTTPVLQRASLRWDVLWLLGVAVVTGLLCLPFVRTVHALGWADEGVTLLGADRLLHGEKLYVDFFEFLPPGTFFITAGWFSVFGTTLASAQSLAIVVIVAIACLIYLSCRQVSGSPSLSALITITWVVMSPAQGYYIIVNHHWFATLFSMMSAWAVFGEAEHLRLRSPLLAGLTAGAAAMVVPTRGAAVVLAAATAYLGRQRFLAEAVYFALACAVVPLCLLFFIVAEGGLLPAYQDVILFPAARYASAQGVHYWDGLRSGGNLLVWLFPFAGFLTLLAVAMNWHVFWRDWKLRTCIAFGLAGWAGFLPRPDIAHIYWAAPLVCPLICYCVRSLIRPLPLWYRYMLAAAAIALCLPSARVYSWGVQRALHADVVATPRGRITLWRDITEGTAQATAWLTGQPAGEKFFFYPYLQMLPFLLDRQQVSKYDLFIPGYTTPEQYQETCFNVMREATWVVIDRTFRENPETLLEAFPAIHDPSRPEMRRFEEVLDENFEPVRRFGAIEIRRRRGQPSETVCVDIAR